MDWPSKIGDWLNLKPERVFAVALATGGLLLLPEGAVEAIGLSKFVEDFRPWIGGVFLISIVIAVIEACAPPARYLKRRAKDWLLLRELSGTLHELSNGEKEVLASFLLKNTKTQGFSAMNGVVAGLEKQQVLVQVTNLGYGANFQFGIQPWAWRYLQKHPELVGITRDQLERART